MSRVLALVVLMAACGKKHAAPAASVPANATPEVRRAFDDLTGLRDAMLRYRDDKTELPPKGDYCPACFVVKNGKEVFAVKDPGPRPHMIQLEKELVDGKYLSSPIPLDPWGHEYTYDDNDPKTDPKPRASEVWSAGPDGKYGTADDVIVCVLPGPGAAACR